MALGSSIGSLVGGVGGAAIGGPMGAMVGSGIGGIAGGLIDLAGQDQPTVAPVDPAQVARLREIRETKRQISEGRDPLTQARVAAIEKQGETAKGQLGKFTGGDVGGTVSAMLRAQRNVEQGTNQAFTQSQQRLPFFENLETQLGNRIAQRKLELDINRADTAAAERANTQNQIIGSIAGTIGSVAGSGVLGGGGGQAARMAGGGGVNAVGDFQTPLPAGITPASQLPTITTPNQQGFGGLQQGGFGPLGQGGF